MLGLTGWSDLIYASKQQGLLLIADMGYLILCYYATVSLLDVVNTGVLNWKNKTKQNKKKVKRYISCIHCTL